MTCIRIGLTRRRRKRKRAKAERAKRWDLNQSELCVNQRDLGTATVNFAFEIDYIGSDANTTAIAVMYNETL